MANIQTQDRVEALQRLIQENQLSFFDALASHPERQQEAVNVLLEHHRQSLEETAAEQFSDVPETARRQVLDNHMQNLERQLTSCLVGFAGNQVALSPLMRIDDCRRTLCYRVVNCLGSLGYHPVISLHGKTLKGFYRENKAFLQVHKLINRTILEKFFAYLRNENDGLLLGYLSIYNDHLELEIPNDELRDEAKTLASNLANLFQVQVIVRL